LNTTNNDKKPFSSKESSSSLLATKRQYDYIAASSTYKEAISNYKKYVYRKQQELGGEG
jgi:hypothetical protein